MLSCVKLFILSEQMIEIEILPVVIPKRKFDTVFLIVFALEQWSFWKSFEKQFKSVRGHMEQTSNKCLTRVFLNDILSFMWKQVKISGHWSNRKKWGSLLWWQTGCVFASNALAVKICQISFFLKVNFMCFRRGLFCSHNFTILWEVSCFR